MRFERDTQTMITRLPQAVNPVFRVGNGTMATDGYPAVGTRKESPRHRTAAQTSRFFTVFAYV
jgi:hypothetical protein